MYAFQPNYSEQGRSEFRVDGLPGSLSPSFPSSRNDQAADNPNGSSSTNAGMKRLSLQLSASLHREAKLAALEDDETLNSMVVGLLRNYLRERRSAAEARQQRRL